MDVDRNALTPAPDTASSGVELSPDQLSPGALRGLVEEYVTREGTDYGQSDWSLEEKVAQVFAQIADGEARIVFDLETESASIVAAPPAGRPLRSRAPRTAGA